MKSSTLTSCPALRVASATWQAPEGITGVGRQYLFMLTIRMFMAQNREPQRLKRSLCSILAE